MKRCRETSGVLNHEASKTHIVVSHCDGRDPAGEHCRDRLPALGRSIASNQHVPTFDPKFTSPDDAARMVRAQWRMPMGPVVNLTRWMEAAGCGLGSFTASDDGDDPFAGSSRIQRPIPVPQRRSGSDSSASAFLMTGTTM
jgi:hypothetical protein